MIFKAIAFDLDGTLVHSAPDVRVSVNQALAKHGRRDLTLDEIKELVGWGAKVLVEKALKLTGVPGDETLIESINSDFLSYYAAHPVVHSHVFPGVIDVLDRLRADGVAMGICTNKPEKTTAPVLAALDLGKYFDVVACGDTLAFKKPDGRHVLHVIDGLGGGRDNGVLIGDSENDINAALDARVKSVAVTYGYAHVPHAELGADILIDDFADLPAALATIGAAMTA